MLDKIYEMLRGSGYTEHRQEVKLEIPDEDILRWIKEGKIRVRKDGYIEVVDKNIVDINPKFITAHEGTN
mgnify:FL=1